MTTSPQDPRPGTGDDPGRDFHNTGVYFGGASTFNGPVAAGYQAHAEVRQGGASDDRARLEELLRQLEAGLRQVGDTPAQGAIADVGRVRHEIDQNQPDKPRISDLLKRITSVLGPASSLLEVVNQIKDLVPLIPH
jgi:hypothetical protein